MKFYNAHDIVIRNCRIHDNWNQGMLGNGNRVLIDRNIIAGNGRSTESRASLMHGIYATGSAFTITNNLIHSNSAYGIQVAAYPYKKEGMAGPEYAWAKNWVIANNTLAFNKVSSGIVLWQDGVENCAILNKHLLQEWRPERDRVLHAEGPPPRREEQHLLPAGREPGIIRDRCLPGRRQPAG